MRMAFCLDGDYERQVGVEATQIGRRLEVRVHAAGDPLNDPETEALRKASCPSDLTSTTTAKHSTRCAWPIRCWPGCTAGHLGSGQPCSTHHTKRLCGQSSALVGPVGRELRCGRVCRRCTGADFELSGIRTLCVPTPSALLEMGPVPGLPADRLPRLHAIAEAAQRGELTPSG